MSSISVYVLILLVFLSLSKGLSLTGDTYISSKSKLSELYLNAPITIILLNHQKRGIFINSYFHEYKIIFGTKIVRAQWFRVSKNVYKAFYPYRGLSIFRKYQKNNQLDYVPAPPGTLYVGDHTFGNWSNINDKKVWTFNSIYKKVEKELKLPENLFTTDYLVEIEEHLKKKKPFWGAMEKRVDVEKEEQKILKNKGAQKKKFFQIYFGQNTYERVI